MISATCGALITTPAFAFAAYAAGAPDAVLRGGRSTSSSRATAGHHKRLDSRSISKQSLSQRAVALPPPAASTGLATHGPNAASAPAPCARGGSRGRAIPAPASLGRMVARGRA